jgi:hypothetical protein
MSKYPDDDDGAVLADLAAQGIDMSQPLEIEFQVAAGDQSSANAIAQSLGKAGYDVQVDFDPGEPDEDGEIDPNDEEFGPAWTVIAAVRMIPECQEIIRIQQDLDRLAGPHGGFSDGWGVLIDGDDE